jgi:5-(carboxyamino)imidazole ribonucleotide synthase
MNSLPPFYRGLRVGILGGGQLGKMLLQAAMDYHLEVHVLDPAADAPCRPYTPFFTQGSLTDPETVLAFGRQCDLLTIEIEHVSAEALALLKAEGKQVFPDPASIALIQDKRAQKQFYAAQGLPTAPFVLTEDRASLLAHRGRLPLVHKLARAGYDGRGVQVLRTDADLARAFDAPGLLEDWVPFRAEIAVLVSRNAQGQTAAYPPVEMVFHPEANLVEYLWAPARLPSGVAQEAEALALRVAEALGYVGLLAVEMFLTEDDSLLINEIAPRPHNSGHHTLRACDSSQYEQHLRAILGLPPGSTRQHSPAAMVNLLGEPGAEGPVVYEGIEAALALPGVYPFLYGKSSTRPFRKMGHVTLLDPDPEALLRRVEQVRSLLRVRAVQ